MSGLLLGYTGPALLAAAATCAAEIGWLRTGLFRRTEYWLCLAIVFAFQIPVDGWLTHGSTPTVVYNPAHILGVRAPLGIPIEDFLFGFALVTLVLLVWEHTARRDGGRR
ncbi:lycopene cyclase domain-containing protein [Nocardia sp. alder85J]|uniref:lycopene cyclase domain-containing protein n=1 Tax=Nocardia sp. alder85J TaxID=2862949 RepID=UPI001CD740E3|nr:lycopene cyclase domain-containing protein [Nocardia sp. alder85J]MCX4094717.1 lycopene cyclase domain-containing protein [Nocardia sp. alder85J]